MDYLIDSECYLPFSLHLRDDPELRIAAGGGDFSATGTCCAIAIAGRLAAPSFDYRHYVWRRFWRRTASAAAGVLGIAFGGGA